MVSSPFLIPSSAGDYFGEVLRIRRAGPFMIRESRYAGGLEMPGHFHPDAYFSYVVRGTVRERSGGRVRDYAAESLHFHPAGESHAACVGPSGATCLSIIPLDEMADRLGSASVPAKSITPSIASLAARCYREAAAIDTASDLALEALAHELIAELLGERSVHGRPAPRWLSDVRDYLRTHFAEHIRLAELSALAGVHEVHLVRAFRTRFGATPGAYVRRLRVEAASRELITSLDPIVDVALAAGFSSQPHFTRVFHSHVGTTPAAYRRAHARRCR